MKKSPKPSSMVAADRNMNIDPQPQDVANTTDEREERSLDHIRAESLRVRHSAVRTILELESWRDEIEATIAFLKAQKK